MTIMRRFEILPVSIKKPLLPFSIHRDMLYYPIYVGDSFSESLCGRHSHTLKNAGVLSCPPCKPAPGRLHILEEESFWGCVYRGYNLSLQKHARLVLNTGERCMSITEMEILPRFQLAVASGMLGLVSILGLMLPVFAFFAVPGVAFGIAARVAIRKYELKGILLAKAGLTLSLIFGMVSPIWAITWYEIRFRSEALPGYRRVNFLEIMKDRKHSESRLAARVGQNVCFKGYELDPGRVKRDTFRMSCQRPSSGFGSKANPEDVVLVKLPEGKFRKWRYEMIAVSGTLVRNPAAYSQSKAPKFILEQSEVFEARTLDGSILSSSSRGEGGC